MEQVNVLQFITPVGFYGAEMWILALAKALDPKKIYCQLSVTKESEDQHLEIYNRFKSLGLDARQIKMNGRFDPRVIVELSRLIKKNKVDIIHTHGYKSDILGLIAARLSGIKAVSTPHGFENVKDVKLQFFIRLGCYALRKFDYVAPLSDELKSDMYRIRVNANKIRLIRNGVDLEEIESERKKHSSSIFVDPDENKIGYVGQMAYRKNIGDLIKAFNLLYKECQDIRLILVGDGPMRGELEQQARSMAASSKIDFLGYRKDRLQILKELDLFCMTSSLEGIPRCMMEAMAMEIPVAAYNIPGVDKLIITEKTGLMVDFGHVEALKESWKRLLFDKDLSAQIAGNGRKYVIENFSAKRMADEYMNLYQEMVKVR